MATKIKENRQHLNAPMDWDQSVEVMHQNMEYIQPFVIQVPPENSNRFCHGLPNGHMYIHTKAIQKWNKAELYTWS